jgi:hypothetical protein
VADLEPATRTHEGFGRGFKVGSVPTWVKFVITGLGLLVLAVASRQLVTVNIDHKAQAFNQASAVISDWEAASSSHDFQTCIAAASLAFEPQSPLGRELEFLRGSGTRKMPAEELQFNRLELARDAILCSEPEECRRLLACLKGGVDPYGDAKFRKWAVPDQPLTAKLDRPKDASDAEKFAFREAEALEDRALVSMGASLNARIGELLAADGSKVRKALAEMANSTKHELPTLREVEVIAALRLRERCAGVDHVAWQVVGMPSASKVLTEEQRQWIAAGCPSLQLESAILRATGGSTRGESEHDLAAARQLAEQLLPWQIGLAVVGALIVGCTTILNLQFWGFCVRTAGALWRATYAGWFVFAAWFATNWRNSKAGTGAPASNAASEMADRFGSPGCPKTERQNVQHSRSSTVFLGGSDSCVAPADEDSFSGREPKRGRRGFAIGVVAACSVVAVFVAWYWLPPRLGDAAIRGLAAGTCSGVLLAGIAMTVLALSWNWGMKLTRRRGNHSHAMRRTIAIVGAVCLVGLVITQVLSAIVAASVGISAAKRDVEREMIADRAPTGQFGAKWLMSSSEVKSLFPDAEAVSPDNLKCVSTAFGRRAFIDFIFQRDALVMIMVSFMGEKSEASYAATQVLLSDQFGNFSRPRPSKDYSLLSSRKDGRVHIDHVMFSTGGLKVEQVLFVLGTR